MDSHMANSSVSTDTDSDRSGFYYCFRRLIVREGECVSIIDNQGRQKVVKGPNAFTPWMSHVSFLNRVACDQKGYLVIEYLNGEIEHKRGPTFAFADPCLHKSVRVESAVLLEANQALVVYTENKTGDGSFPKNVTRRIVKGPEVFIPESNEWLHRYSWHGTRIAGQSKGSITGEPNDTKVAHAVEFTKLRQLPDQMYYTVRDLRSSDDALLTLHIMIFFELVDIERMLDMTNDPISDIINAANADVMTFGACRTYERLLAESSGLSENASYPLLAARMASIGYKLNKVVYRGYHTSSQLQQMQETAISSRTKLRLQADTQRHEQMNMAAQLKATEEHDKHRFTNAERATLHQVRLRQLTEDQELAAVRSKNQVALEHERAMNNERKEFLKSLSEMDVDLTKYLVAQVGSKPTSHLLIESAGDATKTPQLHIH
jgi:hypothetical protein